MKKFFLIAGLVLATQIPALALAKAASTYSVILAGGTEPNMISIQLSPDGRTYVIDSIVQLEVGSTICSNPPGTPNELDCQAAAVGSFEVNGGEGNDTVTLGRTVPVPVTLRGGAGDDYLVGGAGSDKLIGGSGNDRLIGRGGADNLNGGEGNDTLVGGSGDDTLRGGPGDDVLVGGSGTNDVHQ